MIDSDLQFNRGAVRAMQCCRDGWQLIKDDYWLFFAITLVAMFIGSAVPFGILGAPMMCGVEICLLRQLRGERASFNLLFDGFNYFGPSVVATIIFSVPLMVVFMLAYFGFFAVMIGVGLAMGLRDGGPPPDARFVVVLVAALTVYLILVMIIVTLLTLPFVFVYPLIVDRQASAMTAIGTSTRAVVANLRGMVGLMLAQTLLSLAAMALCCFGVYLLLPISMAAYAVAYRQVFPDRHAPREVIPVDEPAPLEAPAADARPSSTGIQAEAPRESAPETGITPE